MIHPNITMYTPGRVHTKQDDLWAKQLVGLGLGLGLGLALALGLG